MTTTTTGFDINAVTWSDPRIIETRAGQRQVRSWEIAGDMAEAFWSEWRTGKLKPAGYSVSKFKNAWTLTEWRKPDGGTTEQAERAKAELEETDRRERHLENYEPELSGLDAKRFARVVEWLTGTDYEYQIPHIKRIAAALRQGFAVDASDTGTGKTGAAVLVAYVLNRALFVMSPLSVLPGWREMAALYKVRLITAINYERVRTGKTDYAAWMLKTTTTGKVIPKHTFEWRKEVLDPENVLIVFDECHKLKDYQTQNCKLGIAAIQAGYKVMALSATAADNPMHMKFIAYGCGLVRRAGDFFGWMLNQGVKKGRFGYFFVGGRPVLTKLHAQIFPMHGSRMRISELGDKFPPTKIISQAYQMDESEDIQKVYDEMNEEIAKLEAKAAKDGTSPQAAIVVAQLRARQRAELLKVPTLVSMAQDAIDEGSSVSVFLNFEDSLRAVALRLQTNMVIHGGQKPEDREGIRKMFQEDKEHVIVCNIKAGGVGISLHGAKDGGRPRLALISPTFSGQDLKQALGRVWRAGGSPSVQKIVFAAGTVEEDVCSKVKAKIQRIDLINDGELDEALSF